jgi:hypothetical protein
LIIAAVIFDSREEHGIKAGFRTTLFRIRSTPVLVAARGILHLVFSL